MIDPLTYRWCVVDAERIIWPRPFSFYPPHETVEPIRLCRNGMTSDPGEDGYDEGHIFRPTCNVANAEQCPHYQPTPEPAQGRPQ